MTGWTTVLSKLTSAVAKKADFLFLCSCKSVSKDLGLRIKGVHLLGMGLQ